MSAAVARDLLVLWKQLMRESAPRTFEIVGELNLSITLVKALHVLDDLGEQSVKDLAALLTLSLPATSRLADTLLKRDLITRREDEHDRRSRLIAITDDGRRLLDQINEARLAGLEQFVAALSPQECDALHAALSPIATRLEQT